MDMAKKDESMAGASASSSSNDGGPWDPHSNVRAFGWFRGHLIPTIFPKACALLSLKCRGLWLAIRGTYGKPVAKPSRFRARTGRVVLCDEYQEQMSVSLQRNVDVHMPTSKTVFCN